MNEFRGKTIVIAAPNHYGLLERFKENLEVIGFTTVVISDDTKVSIGLKNSLIHIFRKFTGVSSDFKREKKIEMRTDNQIQCIQSQHIEKFDYALFIRPDLFSNGIINYVKNKAEITCAYQWDGLDRFPSVYSKIHLFDRFFVFDKNDLKKNSKLLPLSNFYFDDITPQKNRIDVYFVGTYMKNRIEILIKLSEKFNELGLKSSINLSAKSSEITDNIRSASINIIDKPILFKDNIINVSQSEIILDLVNDVHNGCSMRVFESVGFRKKLITNNSLVKDYDFYDPNNIFVIEDEKLSGVEHFIQTPYHNLPEEIYKKYSFTRWIKYVLGIK